MRTEVWKIDPPRAAELLASMKYNRTISPTTVDRYTRIMLAGRWRLNGASLSVFQDSSGATVLLNGAHRLTALIKSGMTLEFLVVFEDDEEVFKTFDVGRNRSTATLLGLRGTSNATQVAAVARMILLYEQAPDELWTRYDIVIGDEVLAWHEALGPDGQAELLTAAHYASAARWHVRSIGAWYGALVWLVQHNSEWAEMLPDFDAALRSGAGLPEGDPRLALRNYVINSTVLRGGAGDVGRQAALTVGIRAWNDWLAGVNRGHYKFQAGRTVNGRRVQSSLPMPKVR